MKKLTYSIIATIMLFICSCNNSIYVYDPIDPRLPIYSETGNNVGGAFINEKLWRSQVTHSNSSDKPRIIFNKTTKRLDLIFRGDSNIYDKIIFSLTLNKDIEKVEDLIKLNETKLAINGTKNIGTLIKKDHFSSSEIKPNNSNGQFYIKNATYNNTENDSFTIISGTFGFNLDTENGNVKVYYGRFDYKIDNDSFWVAEN